MSSRVGEGPATTPVVGQQAAQQLRAALARVKELSEAEEATVAARKTRRQHAAAVKGEAAEKTYTRACAACRKAKNRCLSESNTAVCPRCAQLGLVCEYPETRNRGPKRRLSKTQRALQDIRRNIEAALAGSEAVDPLEEDEDVDSADEFDLQGCVLLPLHRTSTLERRLTRPIDAGTAGRRACCRILSRSSPIKRRLASTLLVKPSHFLMLVHQRATLTAVCQVRCSRLRLRTDLSPRSGLYIARPETDFSVDPITCGILTVDDFDRLLGLYFEHLFPFLYLLLADLHTADFLRLNSPFLTTCVAFVASTYDSLSGHLVPTLERHALSLATRIFEEGLKSIEIVQGFFILS